GIGAYQVHSPAQRLSTVGFAVAIGSMAWTATLYNERSQPGKLEARILGWIVGLIMSSVAKFGWRTNNPIWPIMHAENNGWNKTGFILAIFAAYHTTRRSPRTGEFVSTSGKKGSSLSAAFGIGGLMFGLHSLLSDSSTMIQWVWEGHPVRGPISVPHGALTLLAMGLGVTLGLKFPRYAGSYVSYGIGAVGAFLLTTKSHWVGYIGAFIMAVYLTALAPVLLSSAIKHNPAFTFGLGFFIYNCMVLFHVWVVAYAFVPGGPLLREHTDWIMISMMLQLGSGVISASTTNSKTAPKINKKPIAGNPQKSRPYYHFILAVLEILGIAIAYLRFPSNDYVSYHAEDKVLTAGIWTVHFSLDNDMWSSEHRMRDALRDLELDVVGLLESDLQRIIMGNRDTTQFLAEDLGMYVDAGPGPNKHTWGCALLSKFPIVNSTHHLLPSPVGELAPAIHATLDVYGEMIDVVVFHSGQEEDVEDRRQQTEYLSHLMAGSPRPLILLSYLVTKPHKGNYNTHVSNYTRMNDIDPSDWDRWCQYILYRGIRRTGYARVSRGTITDTEIQVGKFVVDGKYTESSNELINESEVPEGLQFPKMFHGKGVRGHSFASQYYQGLTTRPSSKGLFVRRPVRQAIMSSRNGFATILGLTGIAVGGFYLYDRGRIDGQRQADRYGVAGHAGSKLDEKAEQLDKRLRSKGSTISQYTREELDAMNRKKDEASRSINERIEGVDRKFEKKASEAKNGMLSWFGLDDRNKRNVTEQMHKDLKNEADRIRRRD
ncbi:hypothetical protein KEM54_006394, partial [Ascosphaera aggregata]